MTKFETNIFQLTFKELLSLPKITKDFSRDDRFDSYEKNILKSLKYYLKKDYHRALNSLNIPFSQDSTNKAIHLYLIGMVYKELKDYDKAIEKLQESFSLVQGCISEITHLPLVSLLKIYVILNDKNNMKLSLEHFTNYPNINPSIKYSKIQAQALYFLKLGKLDQAKALLYKTIENPKKGFEKHKRSLQKTLFYVHFEAHEYNACYNLLEQYRLNRGFSIPANYQYLKILLDNVVHQKPIPINLKSFNDHFEKLHILKTIQYLESKNINDATESWKELMKINPQIYKNDFHYEGGDSLLTKLLRRYHIIESHSKINTAS